MHMGLIDWLGGVVLEDVERELAGVGGLHVDLRAVQLLLEPLVGARVDHLALHLRTRRRPSLLTNMSSSCGSRSCMI